MQTFLPLPDMLENARVLDRHRLGKQRVESWQILRVLIGCSQGWVNHPAVKMWKGSELALCEYGLSICREWVSQGYKDTMTQRFLESRKVLFEQGVAMVLPSWMGCGEFHSYHRSNLLRKNPTWYGRFGWSEPPDLPYQWPTNLRV